MFACTILFSLGCSCQARVHLSLLYLTKKKQTKMMCIEVERLFSSWWERLSNFLSNPSSCRVSLVTDDSANEGKVLEIFQVDCSRCNWCRVDDYRPSQISEIWSYSFSYDPIVAVIGGENMVSVVKSEWRRVFSVRSPFRVVNQPYFDVHAGVLLTTWFRLKTAPFSFSMLAVIDRVRVIFLGQECDSN